MTSPSPLPEHHTWTHNPLVRQLQEEVERLRPIVSAALRYRAARSEMLIAATETNHPNYTGDAARHTEAARWAYVTARTALYDALDQIDAALEGSTNG